jgi:hypothetical protein
MYDLARGGAVVEATRGGPAPPDITHKDIWAQFKIDIAGKEVQTAETYSHSWIANQFGHVCLPYLFRLAEAPPTMDDEDAQNLYDVIKSNPPPKTAPIPIVIGGPIGSGRTELCAGIGTEFAFRRATVRYLSFATLLEFAARSQNSDFFDDSGPANIAYWAWSKAQVVIIDDIGPVLTPIMQNRDDQVPGLRQVLYGHLGTVRAVLARCHTVWVIGDPWGDERIAKDDDALDRLADEIRNFCTIQDKPRPEVLVVQLNHGAPERTPKAPRVRTRYLR